MGRKTLKEVGQDIKTKEQLEKEKVRQDLQKVGEQIIETPTEVYEIAKRSLKATFDLIASRFGDKWKLQEEELDELTNSYVALANKYIPKLVAKFSIEADAMICTAFIILKRITK